MRFIDPQTDYAFKKIFGSTRSKPILLSFLNALLYEGNSTITDLEIINPAQEGAVFELKDSYLDVKARLASGETVIIEMQVLNHTGFAKRIIYNTCKAYDSQLLIHGQYDSLKPVIALTITDFKLFKETDQIITKFVLKENKSLFDYPAEITLMFVELSKFKAGLSELKDLTDIWLYFLKEAGSLQSIPEKLGEIPAVNLALEIANQANMTADELERLQKHLFFIADQKKVLRQKEQLVGEKEQLASEKEQLASEKEQLTTEKEYLVGENQLLIKQQRNLLKVMLAQKFGSLDESFALQIDRLSVAQLGSLGEILVRFESISDLTNWLEQLDR